MVGAASSPRTHSANSETGQAMASLSTAVALALCLPVSQLMCGPLAALAEPLLGTFLHDLVEGCSTICSHVQEVSFLSCSAAEAACRKLLL